MRSLMLVLLPAMWIQAAPPPPGVVIDQVPAAGRQYVGSPSIVILRGQENDVEAWRAELDKLYDPKRLVFAVPAGAANLPDGIATKAPGAGTVAYICRGMTCSPPVTTLGALVRELRDGPWVAS